MVKINSNHNLPLETPRPKLTTLLIITLLPTLLSRSEREKQREFLDKYYEEQLRDQIGTLEERIAAQTRQFKQYITEIQTTHEDEVEALRSQLSELQQNFRLVNFS